MAVISGCFADGVPNAEDVLTIRCLEPLFANVISALVAFVGVVLFLMLIVGGFSFMFAGGDPKKMEKAKGTLSAAVIGLVVIAVAYLILLLIQTFTGVNVTIFKIFINP